MKGRKTMTNGERIKYLRENLYKLHSRKLEIWKIAL